MDLNPKKRSERKKATPPVEDLLGKGMGLLWKAYLKNITLYIAIAAVAATMQQAGKCWQGSMLIILALRQLYFVDSDGRGGYTNTARKIKPLKTVCGFDLVGCCNGLLCISIPKYYHSKQVRVLQICNPLVTASNSIELPVPNRLVNQREIFGFGFHQRSREFKVIRIVFYELIMTGRRERVTVHKSEVQVLTVGTTEWRKKGASPYNFELKPPEALVEGSLHLAVPYFNYHHRVISFELAEEVFKEIPLLDCIEEYYSGYHLSELNGCLTVAGLPTRHLGDEGEQCEGILGERILYQPLCSSVPLFFFFDGQNGMNGDVVLECNKRALVSSDPKTDGFKALKINRLPQQFQAFAFQPTLFSVRETVEMKV
ncbi:hypothetical protein SLEP1_g25811 [Rubroshorea leprosula]|uniref:F-box associated beta-propeller type 3 domain-containing protein n=1 Tax=Rubroshorea leprosula TaxID=152421 RepID=A0AAV5JXL9_9ROSI|nr:hypothetical protein SLEP1_g25811 [Rubroshorea leprosula]